MIRVEIAPGVLVQMTEAEAEERGLAQYQPLAPARRARGDREVAALVGGPERAAPQAARKRRGGANRG